MTPFNILSYSVTQEIGRGGMGVVYKAVHTKLGREVAIKELFSNLTSNPEFRERFLNEAKILAKISHPGIVGVYDFIEEHGKFYIIMEYIKGYSLGDLTKENPYGIHIARTIKIFSKILEAFDYAHRDLTNKPAIVHRDIKPDNILITEEDSPKILDFGIAKVFDKNQNLTRAGTKMGTLLYMSPEQVSGYPLDHRSDIYSLGLLLYEMLISRPALQCTDTNDYQIMETIVKSELPSIKVAIPLIDVNIDNAYRKATEKNPELRFRTCGEFLEALNNTSFTHTATDYTKTRINYSNTYSQSQNTVYTQPENQYTQIKKKSLMPITLIISTIAIGLIVVMYLLFSNSQPAFTLYYNPNENITKKSNNTFEVLYKTSGNIKVLTKADKDPGNTYNIIIDGLKRPAVFNSNSNGEYEYNFDIPVEGASDKKCEIIISNQEGKNIFKDIISINVLKPSVSSSYIISSYLLNYSNAISERSSYKLTETAGFWIPDRYNEILSKMQKGFSTLTAMNYTNPTNYTDDKVSADITFNFTSGNYSTFNYNFEMKVVKNASGTPEWKIAKAKETKISGGKSYNSFDDYGD
jgi:serine/threonine protein kinase